MGTILTSGKNTLAPQHEVCMYGGNSKWASPEEARAIGSRILGELVERYAFIDRRDSTPEIPEVSGDIFRAALSAINYAALPTERRANILHGLINAAAEAGVLGGNPEWIANYRQGDES